MVAHWWKNRGRRACQHAVNGLGATRDRRHGSGHGGRQVHGRRLVVVLLVPSLIVVMLAVRRHYRRIDREIAAPGNLKLENLQEPL